jgi:O-antigen ligase
MPTLGQQRIDSLGLGVLVGLLVLAAAAGLLAPQLFPWSILALAAGALVLYWAVKWEITVWAWVWVLSYGLLDRPFWVLEIPGFFNMTIPRLIFVAATVAFVLHFALRNSPVVFNRPVVWALAALTACCAASATAAGWVAEDSPIASAPYFRFLGSLLMPLVMFFLVLNATRNPRQVHWALLMLSVYGWYALYIAYLQYTAIMGAEGARAFIWPSYINQPSWGPTYGIHFDRARGAYTMCNPQALLLVAVFYGDLFLFRKIHGPYRAALAIQAILIPPAIFFTGLRSAYVGFLAAGAIWLLWSGPGRLGKAKLAVVALAVVIAAAALWENLAQENRATGGVAQKSPIVGRQVLAKRSLVIFTEHPLFGAGFGHYLEAEHKLQSDPSELTQLSTGLATPHNLFLVMLAETGLVGVVCVLAVIAALLRETIGLYRKLPRGGQGTLSRDFVVFFWSAAAAYFIDTMLVDPLWDAASSAMFWTLAGLVVGFNRLLEWHPLELPASSPVPAA